MLKSCTSHHQGLNLRLRIETIKVTPHPNSFHLINWPLWALQSFLWGLATTSWLACSMEICLSPWCHLCHEFWNMVIEGQFPPFQKVSMLCDYSSQIRESRPDFYARRWSDQTSSWWILEVGSFGAWESFSRWSLWRHPSTSDTSEGCSSLQRWE